MMRTLDTYTPTRFMAAGSTYDKRKADFAVAFIQALKHTKGRWSGQPFQLIDWQEQIIRDLFGTVTPSEGLALRHTASSVQSSSASAP